MVLSNAFLFRVRMAFIKALHFRPLQIVPNLLLSEFGTLPCLFGSMGIIGYQQGAEMVLDMLEIREICVETQPTIVQDSSPSLECTVIKAEIERETGEGMSDWETEGFFTGDGLFAERTEFQNSFPMAPSFLRENFSSLILNSVYLRIIGMGTPVPRSVRSRHSYAKKLNVVSEGRSLAGSPAGQGEDALNAP